MLTASVPPASSKHSGVSKRDSCLPKRPHQVRVDNVRQHVRKRKRLSAQKPSEASAIKAPVIEEALQTQGETRHLPSQLPPAPSTSPGPTPTSLSTDARSVPHSSFLGRSGYITSDDLAIDENDAMQYEASVNKAGSLADLQSSMLRMASSICLPAPSLRLSLLNSFVVRGLPWMPITNRTELERCASHTNPSLLLTAALVAGSKLSTAPNALEWGEKCYFYAKSLLFNGSGHSTLHLIISTIILHWWNPSGPEHISLDSSSLWLRISVGLAHQYGLHREPDASLPEARLRRRIWWTLVVSFML